MVDQIRFFAAAARHLEGKSAGEYMANMTSIIRREPVGVCAQVAPWNYPMMMAVWKFAPAIAAGNTVVLKPSDTTPASDDAAGRDRRRVPPAGRVQRDLRRPRHRPGDGRPTTPRRWCRSPGRCAPAWRWRRAPRPSLKRVHLELGGKAPVVVFDDADIAAAAEAIAVAGYFNAGQDCTAATRVIAGPGVYADFVDALAEQAKGTKTGMPDDDDVLYGPVNNPNQLDRVAGFVERDAGPRPRRHRRLTRSGDTGYFYEPTVVADLRQDDEMIQNEIFGPVITVQRSPTRTRRCAGRTACEYGLASSVWTKDFGRAMRMAKRLDFGCVWINTHIPIVAEMPHGGFKKSGYGKDLSMYGFEDYTRIKHVMANLDS